MKPKIVLERLYKKLARLETEREKLQAQIMKYQSPTHRYTKTGRVINEVVNYINRTQQPVSLGELLDHLRVNVGMFWKPEKSPSGLLSAMLINESKRKYARVVKIGRGNYLVPSLVPKFSKMLETNKNPQPSVNGAGVTEKQTKN